MNKKKETIFVHLPAYRDPELIPTIEDALKHAKNPKQIHFGICRQYHPEDTFDNLDKYRKDKRFHILDFDHKVTKGLPWARAQINENLLTNQTYILQLDSHHRFAQDWDETLINMHNDLEKKGYKPILTGYLPLYTPFNDPKGRSTEPWQQQFAAFYPHGTIFIRPSLLEGWDSMTEPPMSRFLSGHFCFARSEWAKEIKHDPDIYFSGEEINLTVRSYTHGYDMFHPHKLIIWHSTMREERAGKLVWDDQSKRGEDMWWKQQDIGRSKIRQLLKTEDNGFDLTGYDLGNVRTLRDYEKYAGIHFKKKAVQKYTIDNKYPPNPFISNDELWEESFMGSFYYLVKLQKHNFPADDYKYIHMAFDNSEGKPIYSRDLDRNFIYSALNTPSGYFDFEEMFLISEKPARLVLWAYSDTRGWCERIEEQIP
jgi:hypothetical protein